MNDKFKDIARKADLVEWDFDKLEFKIVPDFEKLEEYTQQVIQVCLSEIALIGLSNSDNDDIAWAADTAIKHIRKKFKTD